MIKITEDKNSEMLRIEFNDKCLFEGNYWDFDVSGKKFAEIFKKCKLKVEILNRDYDEWYE